MNKYTEEERVESNSRRVDSVVALNWHQLWQVSEQVLDSRPWTLSYPS